MADKRRNNDRFGGGTYGSKSSQQHTAEHHARNASRYKNSQDNRNARKLDDQDALQQRLAEYDRLNEQLESLAEAKQRLENGTMLAEDMPAVIETIGSVIEVTGTERQVSAALGIRSVGAILYNFLFPETGQLSPDQAQDDASRQDENNPQLYPTINPDDYERSGGMQNHHRPGKKPQHKRAGEFNLVTPLVVMTIIGLLLMMLVPAVQQGREAARRTGDLNNERQTGLGLQGYMDSNREEFPVSGNILVGKRRAPDPNPDYGQAYPTSIAEQLDPFISNGIIRNANQADPQHYWQTRNLGFSKGMRWTQLETMKNGTGLSDIGFFAGTNAQINPAIVSQNFAPLITNPVYNYVSGDRDSDLRFVNGYLLNDYAGGLTLRDNRNVVNTGGIPVMTPQNPTTKRRQSVTDGGGTWYAGPNAGRTGYYNAAGAFLTHPVPDRSPLRSSGERLTVAEKPVLRKDRRVNDQEAMRLGMDPKGQAAILNIDGSAKFWDVNSMPLPLIQQLVHPSDGQPIGDPSSIAGFSGNGQRANSATERENARREQAPTERQGP